jgi:glutamate dehydrogenase (NAD(P)+)
MDTYSMTKGVTVRGVVTGKPLDLGGSLGRNEATARGVTTLVKRFAPLAGIEVEGATVAIQGFGNAGSMAARLLSGLGARVIAVSDSRAALHAERGLDVEAAIAHKRETGSLEGFEGADAIPHAELLELECDVLIPAALENQLTADNAPRVRARLIAEAANGPTTPEADAILDANGVHVVPDILANAGGVIVSYFEWVQSLSEYFWSEGQVHERLEGKLLQAAERVLERAHGQGVTLRTASYSLAVERVANATRERGLFP